MFFFIIPAIIGLVVAFATIAYFDRGNKVGALLAFVVAAFVSVFLMIGVAGIATAVSDDISHEQWTVTDVQSHSGENGVYYSYFNGDTQYNFNNDELSSIKRGTEDYSYRVKECGLTPNWVLPEFLTDMGTCYDYLYLAKDVN